MKKTLLLLLILLGLSLPSHAQNSFYGSAAFKYVTGFPPYPGSGATITVCSFGASGTPCSPTVPVCSGPTDLVCGAPNPFVADPNGNFGFWAPAGNYTVTITGANIQSYVQTVSINAAFNPAANIAFTGLDSFSQSVALNGGAVASALTITGFSGCLQASSGVVGSTGVNCGSSAGTITATGSPATGNLTKFSGASSITNGDLSGDVSTSGTLTTTVNKVNGVSYNPSPATNTVPVVTAGGTTTYVTIPNCLDSAGQHLNYNNSTFTFVCGTTSSANFGRNTFVCTTGSSAGSSCTTTVNLNFTEPDTNYSVAPACISPSGFPTINIFSKGTSSVTIQLTNGTASEAQASSCAEADVVVTGS